MSHVAAAVRSVQWGHWGITFFWQVEGQYAPERIEGELYFPVSARGPCDGYLGSPEREAFKAACAAWVSAGVLPAGLRRLQT